jgi:hypothetical protein
MEGNISNENQLNSDASISYDKCHISCRLNDLFSIYKDKRKSQNIKEKDHGN